MWQVTCSSRPLTLLQSRMDIPSFIEIHSEVFEPRGVEIPITVAIGFYNSLYKA